MAALTLAGTTRRTPDKASEVVRYLRSSFGLRTDASAQRRQYSFADVMRLVCAFELVDCGLNPKNLVPALNRLFDFFEHIAGIFQNNRALVLDKRPIAILRLNPLIQVREDDQLSFEYLADFSEYMRVLNVHRDGGFPMDAKTIEMAALALRAYLRLESLAAQTADDEEAS
jgi:hypothetical protein